MTNWELGNNMGFQCPKCKSGAHLYIHAVINVVAELTPDGCDNDGGDTEWNDRSTAQCYASGCNWTGRVKDLIVLSEDDFDPDAPWVQDF